MTREEVIRIATGLRTDFKCESDIMVDFCNSIIKELKQKPCKTVLEDIKAELQKKEFYIDSTQLAKNVYKEAINDAIEIIDKHMAEAENT